MAICRYPPVTSHAMESAAIGADSRLALMDANADFSANFGSSVGRARTLGRRVQRP
jgi:hypothetical protein